jgi:hypothetical protein
VRASPEDTDDDVEGSFYKELEQIYDQFPRYHVNILLGDFNTKVGHF